MFFNPTSLPYSLFTLMVDHYLPITDDFSYRPDILVGSVFSGADLGLEVVCNLASNLSPISFESGHSYLLPSRLFQSYILGV